MDIVQNCLTSRRAHRQHRIYRIHPLAVRASGAPRPRSAASTVKQGLPEGQSGSRQVMVKFSSQVVRVEVEVESLFLRF